MIIRIPFENEHFACHHIFKWNIRIIAPLMNKLKVDKMEFNFFVPTKVLLGPGKINELARVDLPGKKALIVITSGTSMKKYGYLERVVSLLKQNGSDSVVYDKILPNPVSNHVNEAAQLACSEGCDFIIGLGGGSAIDSAKAIAITAKNGGDYWDYVMRGTGGKKPITKGALPVVVISTTSGTGTECDPFFVITKTETNEKLGMMVIPHGFPTLAIVDPELQLTVPPNMTAFQGFDALFHCVECYISKLGNTVSDLFCEKTFELILKNLPTAVKNGNDVYARTNMAMANICSGMSESTSGLCSKHALANTIGGFYPEVPHGAALIMICEAYYKFFAGKVPEKLAKMARILGYDVDSLPEEKRGYAFAEVLIELQKACNVYGLKMSDYGITKDSLKEIVQRARDNMMALFDRDPYKLSFEETMQIMEESYC